MFLIRTAFWVTLVLVLLPVDRERAGIAEGPGTLETLSALQTVVSDVRGFCTRHPQSCQTGAASLDVLRQKAVYSAGVVQTWLSPSPGGGDAPVVHVDRVPSSELPVTVPASGADDQVAALIEAADAQTSHAARAPL